MKRTDRHLRTLMVDQYVNERHAENVKDSLSTLSVTTASQAYRDGWDKTFAKKPTPEPIAQEP